MFKEAELLGVSLKKRSRRRALVVITFALLAGCIGLISIQSMPNAANVIGEFAVLVFIVVTRGIFGSIVQQQLVPLQPEEAGRTILPLGLARSIPPLNPDFIEPDEYEITIRNDAYYRAYRCVAGYSFIVLLVIVWFFREPAPARQFLTFATVLVLIAMIFTLPQAIIIWRQPDMPADMSEEA